MEGDTGAATPAPPAGSVPTAGTPPIASGPVQRLTYDGRLGELYRIFIVNLLLAIVTLGVYRFWGKTRIRRYLLSRLSYDGDRFEYTGTGGEMFRGFLVVAAILAAIALLLGTLDLLMALAYPDDLVTAQLTTLGLQYLIYLVGFYLLLVGQYMALRYRLSRSRWRGIRGGLSGSPWVYGVQAFAWMLAVAASLGFAKPVADISLWRVRLRNLFFGTAQAKLMLGADTTGLYGPYVAGWFATLVGMIVFYSGLIGVVAMNADLFAQFASSSSGDIEQKAEQMMRDPAFWTFYLQVVAAFVLLGGLVWTFVTFFGSWYLAVLGNRLGATTELAGLRLAPRLTMGRLGRLLAGNMLIATVTLGFGLPIVLHRTWRFLADNVEIAGVIDGTAIGQSQLAMPGRGEGLLEAFDAGGAF